jgi:hypothetical protein
MAAQNRGARRPGEPELMGAKEAAQALGVGQTNLRVLPGLPEPYDKVGATTWWRADEITELAQKRGAKRKMEAVLEAEAMKRQAAKPSPRQPWEQSAA